MLGSYRLAFFATLLAFIVVILGAYTRLTDAGLGCPDWPGCYGQLIPKISTPGIEPQKAWTEMIHRYVAGLLGILILALGIMVLRYRQQSEQPLMLPLLLVVMVVFQALLGMWTVTLKLFPLVVVAHLLGGLATLSLLWRLTLALKPRQSSRILVDHPNRLRVWSWLALGTLVIQLFLGGWTSANYAALVCLDFPACQAGQFFPGQENVEVIKAFNLIKTPLDMNARVVIHMIHRIGALMTALIIGGLGIQLIRRRQPNTLRIAGVIIGFLLILQLSLGITNVLAILPLPIAVAHNAVAALLLLALITLHYDLHPSSKPQH